MAEWVGAGTLGMGDKYRLSNVSPVHTIKWVQDLNDGSFYFEHAGPGNDASRNYLCASQVQLTRRAPKCPCGRRFEHCENECDWPEEIENAYFGRA